MCFSPGQFHFQTQPETLGGSGKTSPSPASQSPPEPQCPGRAGPLGPAFRPPVLTDLMESNLLFQPSCLLAKAKRCDSTLRSRPFSFRHAISSLNWGGVERDGPQRRCTNSDHVGPEPQRHLSEKRGTLWAAAAFLRAACWVGDIRGAPALLMPAHFPFSVYVLSLLCTPRSRIPSSNWVPSFMDWWVLVHD